MLPQPPPNLKEIENSLTRIYVRIYKAITREEGYPSNFFFIQRKYNKIVYDNTRAALSQVQQLSSEFVNRKTKTNSYPTLADIELIKQQTQKTVDSFWRKIQIDIQRTAEDKETDIITYMEIVAISAATGTLALSTKSKINQIIQPNRSLTGGSSFSDIPITPTETTAEIKLPLLLWIARLDEKTCIELPNGDPGCGALNGTTWFSDDPTIPTPGELGPQGTHPHCRCFLDLIMPDDGRYQRLLAQQ